MAAIKKKEPELWMIAIDNMNTLVTKCCQDRESFKVGGEFWQITNYKYSLERHRLTVELDGGEFLLIFKYSSHKQRLTVSAWQNREYGSDKTGPEYDDEGRNDDSVLVLEMTYSPRIGVRKTAERKLMIRDEMFSFQFETQKNIRLH
jgi:hypothetical protein